MPQSEQNPTIAIPGRRLRLKTGLAAGLGLFVFAVAAPAAPAFAQSQPTEATQLKSLIKDLNAELQRGEDKRLIDPWFLRDLRQTISRYDNPWDTLIFEDNFSSQGSRPGPPWQVISGEILVDWRYGMRSVVQPIPQADEQQQAAQENSLGQIFGAFIKEATKNRQDQREQTPSQPAEASVAAAVAPVSITNAFAIRLELTSRPVEGVESPRFEFGPYQGEGAAAGYRLALLPGQKPSLELTSVSSRNTLSTIALYDDPLGLEDGQTHVIEWTRNGNGEMIVRVDGKEVMNVVDRRFSGSFDGFSMANRGGDIALRSIRIDGTR